MIAIVEGPPGARANEPGQNSNISRVQFLTQKFQEIVQRFNLSECPTWTKSALKIVSLTGTITVIAVVVVKYLLPFVQKPLPHWPIVHAGVLSH